MKSVTHISAALGWKGRTKEGKKQKKTPQKGKVGFQETQEYSSFQWESKTYTQKKIH